MVTNCIQSKHSRDTAVCAEIWMLAFHVPVTFLGTEGVSPRRDGRYHSFNSILLDLTLVSYLNLHSKSRKGVGITILYVTA